MTALLPEKPAVMAHTLADLPDAPPQVRAAIGAGLLRALGLTSAPESDFEQSVRLGLTEGFTAYDTRITEAAQR